MATLHIVTQSPFASEGFDTCLAYMCPGHAILLIQDAVIAALPAVFQQKEKNRVAKMRDIALYALEEDLKARGIAPTKLLDWVNVCRLHGLRRPSRSADKNANLELASGGSPSLGTRLLDFNRLR